MIVFEEVLSKYKDIWELPEFLLFVKDNMTTTQCKEANAITDNEEFLQYLLCAFGCYSLSHKRGVPHLIRNPEALSLSPEQQKQLVDVMREVIVTEIETAKAKKAAIKRPDSK